VRDALDAVATCQIGAVRHVRAGASETISGLYGDSSVFSASAEGDDAANRIVWRDADGYPIARDHLDAEAAHPAAELSQDLMALVTLHSVETAAMDRHDRALHIYQIILAQLLSFPIKECATFWRAMQTACSVGGRAGPSRLERPNRSLYTRRQCGVVVSLQ
jgi:hypothetical protein